jgi:hypothetical protein
MGGDETEQALLFLLDSRRQSVVLPVVGKLLAVAGEQAARLGDAAQVRLRDALLMLFQRGGALLHLPSAQAQALRVLQALPADSSPETHALLQQIFTHSTEALVRREILLLWGAWRVVDALRAVVRGRRLRTGWEERALGWAMASAGLPLAGPTTPNRNPRGPCDSAWVQWLAVARD